MKRRSLFLLFTATLSTLVITTFVSCQTVEDPQAPTLITEAERLNGFTRAEPGLTLSFPEDHGPHEDFQTEWWYYTGNLFTEDGDRFGYQLTFFRRALVPDEMQVERESEWGSDQIYMGHFALTDGGNGDFYAFERFARGGADLAGAELPYTVWLEGWRVEEIGSSVTRMVAFADDIELELTLTDLSGPVLQGDDGYSQKGPEEGNASYYYSLVNLESSGTIRVGEDTYTVNGLSWMDHEYSTSALSPGQLGWDWFSIQLDDGARVMIYNLRREDGTVDLFAKGSYIHPDGTLIPLSYEDGDYSIEVLNTWRSPHSGAVYPSGWRVELAMETTGFPLALEITPVIPDQELNVSYTYWEGAVDVIAYRSGVITSGVGYVELTGYASSLAGQF